MDSMSTHVGLNGTRDYPFWHPPSDKSAFPWTDDLALDLMRGMLEPNPTDRITVADALKHAFFEGEVTRRGLRGSISDAEFKSLVEECKEAHRILCMQL